MHHLFYKCSDQVQRQNSADNVSATSIPNQKVKERYGVQWNTDSDACVKFYGHWEIQFNEYCHYFKDI